MENNDLNSQKQNIAQVNNSNMASQQPNQAQSNIVQPAATSQQPQVPLQPQNQAIPVQQPQASNIVLPEVQMPVQPQHIPTVEELEAQKKAEQAKIIQEKQNRHKQNFYADEQVLYTVEEEKEGNPLVVIGFFIALVLFIFVLPKITIKLGNFYTEQSHNNTPVETPKVEEEKEDKKHKFNDNQNRVKIGTLELTNFVKSYQNKTYGLNFTIINSGEETYTFDKKYYVVMYDDEKIIYRALIHSYEPLGSKSAQELSLIISKKAYESANYFTLEEITIGQYPNVNITANSGDYKILTCNYENNTIEYYLEDDMLTKIKDTYKETLDNSASYSQNKYKYQSLAMRYNDIKGMNSTFIETPSDFTMITEFSLKDIQDRTLSDLEVYRFYKFRERSKVIVFENIAQGYTCDNN